MDLSVIVVNWNSVKFLKPCLASVLRETQGIDYEIIVIDGASFDGSAQMVHDEFPSVRFIQGQHNLGFGQANNQAFEAARGDFILFLNPDTEVIGPAIQAMHAALHTLDSAGAVGCRLLNADGSLQTSCVQSYPTIVNQVLDADFLRDRWPSARLWGTRALYEQNDAPKAVEAIAGACVMMKREVFERVGRFSKDYFMYTEDIDLCYKIQSLGLLNYYMPAVSVLHHGGGSSQEAPSDFSVVMMRESIFRFLATTRGRGYAALYRLAMFASALVRLAAMRVLALVGGYRNPQRHLTHAVKKWRAVLHWSLQRRSLVRRYDPTV